MKRLAACILLTVCMVTVAVPTYARLTPEQRAAEKRLKQDRKRWNDYAKKQRKAERKAEKQMRKLNKQHGPH